MGSRLDSGLVLGAWAVTVAACLVALVRDLRRRNAGLASLMKAVWILTVLYSGPIGLAVYWGTGRKEIPADTDGRRAWRSTAHCYSGCGAGEVVGVAVAAGFLALGNWGVAAVSFSLAYLFGYALTVGPLLQEGVALKTALWDAFVSESASITVMEVAAIGTDLLLAGGARFGDVRFWSGLIVSLSVGFFVAYPVNVWLVKAGVKEGMMDPRKQAGEGLESG